jgi:hypothetical protein
MTYKTNSIKKGGCQNLLVYQMVTIIYDLTVTFCKSYLSYESKGFYTRTYDQMIQAARSGKQNIVESSLEKSMKGNI